MVIASRTTDKIDVGQNKAAGAHNIIDGVLPQKEQQEDWLVRSEDDSLDQLIISFMGDYKLAQKFEDLYLKA